MDPIRHPSPPSFDPTRYLGFPPPASRDHYAFGAGRRICQGKHIAERSLLLGIALMLWAFSLSCPTDASGSEMRPDIRRLAQGLSVMPERFPARICVRSEGREELVKGK